VLVDETAKIALAASDPHTLPGCTAVCINIPGGQGMDSLRCAPGALAKARIVSPFGGSQQKGSSQGVFVMSVEPPALHSGDAHEGSNASPMEPLNG
jgi:hypothetical protein